MADNDDEELLEPAGDEALEDDELEVTADADEEIPIDAEEEEGDDEGAPSGRRRVAAAPTAEEEETANAAARRQVRDKLAADVEEFLKRGGKIETIAEDVRADPPKKPENKYGSRSI